MSGYTHATQAVVSHLDDNRNWYELATSNGFRAMIFNGWLPHIAPAHALTKVYALKGYSDITMDSLQVFALTSLSVHLKSVFTHAIVGPQQITKRPKANLTTLGKASMYFAMAATAIGAYMNTQAILSFSVHSIATANPIMVAANGFIQSLMCLSNMASSIILAERARKKRDPVYLLADREKKIDTLKAKQIEMQTSKFDGEEGEKYLKTLQKSRLQIMKELAALLVKLSEQKGTEKGRYSKENLLSMKEDTFLSVLEININELDETSVKSQEIIAKIKAQQTLLEMVDERVSNGGHLEAEKVQVQNDIERMQNQRDAVRAYKDGDKSLEFNYNLGQYLVEKQKYKYVTHVKEAVSWGLASGGASAFGMIGVSLLMSNPVTAGFFALAGISAFAVALTMMAIDREKGRGFSVFGIRSAARRRYEAGFDFHVESFSKDDPNIRSLKDQLEKVLSTMDELKKKINEINPHFHTRLNTENKAKLNKIKAKLVTLKAEHKTLSGELRSAVEEQIVSKHLNLPANAKVEEYVSKKDITRIASIEIQKHYKKVIKPHQKNREQLALASKLLGETSEPKKAATPFAAAAGTDTGSVSSQSTGQESSRPSSPGM